MHSDDADERKPAALPIDRDCDQRSVQQYRAHFGPRVVRVLLPVSEWMGSETKGEESNRCDDGD